MLKIQTIINYNKQDIKQREREFDVEKDPKMVELNDTSKKFKRKYVFLDDYHVFFTICWSIVKHI